MQQQIKEWFSTSINEQERPIHATRTTLKKANSPINEDTLIKLLPDLHLHGQLPSTPSDADTLALSKMLKQVIQELKVFQDQSEGRIRLQYAFSEAEKWFYIVGHIADFDDEAKYLLYDYKFKAEDFLEPFGWEVSLSVVQKTDQFRSYVSLSDV
jgi:hypothetical protein